LKRVGRVFDAIVDRENLMAAAWRAGRGKRGRLEVREFFMVVDAELHAINVGLARGSWRFSPYSSFQVRDTKARTIHAPAFRDRVIHHAIIRVVGPVLERGALDHSFACRAGRGQHAALRVARQWTRRTGWYGKVDVEKFYDSVDHATLRRLLVRRFREKRLLELFDSLLDSYHTAPGKGLPIGALTSQYLGNFYLDELDRRVKATGLAHRYLRYMDDIVIWGDQASLATIRNVVDEGLASLGLRPKHGGEWNRCERGVPLLGFVVYPDRVRVGRQGRVRLRRKLRGMERQWTDGVLDERALQDRGTSLFAHVTTADDSAWRRTVLSLSRLRDDEREALEPQPRGARRLLEQRRQELPLRVSQQQDARQPQQQPGLPGLFGSRHDDREQTLGSPDDVPSCSGPNVGLDESSGKPSADVDLQCGQLPERTTENMVAEAPLRQTLD
jgi:RNA-directed DNA polymerase